MNFETILYTKENGIAKVTMNRPHVRNAQNGRMIEEMDIAFTDAERDKEIRVVILAANGPSFSSGHDLKDYPVEEGGLFFAPTAEGKWEYERDYFYEKLLKTWRMKKPVIAQVQGHCLGAAFMVANMCDLIVASEDAQFGDPVVRMGAASVEVLCHPWVLPPRIAKELLLTGNSINAEQAFQHGMVNRVVPLNQLEETTNNLAIHVSKMPPFAVSMIKHTINRTMDMMGFSNSLNAHFDTHVLTHVSSEALELLDANRLGKASIKEFIKERDSKFNTLVD